jgi:hypothetical protein
VMMNPHFVHRSKPCVYRVASQVVCVRLRCVPLKTFPLASSLLSSGEQCVERLAFEIRVIVPPVPGELLLQRPVLEDGGLGLMLLPLDPELELHLSLPMFDRLHDHEGVSHGGFVLGVGQGALPNVKSVANDFLITLGVVLSEEGGQSCLLLPVVQIPSTTQDQPLSRALVCIEALSVERVKPVLNDLVAHKPFVESAGNLILLTELASLGGPVAETIVDKLCGVDLVGNAVVVLFPHGVNAILQKLLVVPLRSDLGANLLMKGGVRPLLEEVAKNEILNL